MTEFVDGWFLGHTLGEGAYGEYVPPAWFHCVFLRSHATSLFPRRFGDLSPRTVHDTRAQVHPVVIVNIFNYA